MPNKKRFEFHFRMRGFEVLNDRDLVNSSTIFAVRNAGYDLFKQAGIYPKGAAGYLINQYQRLGIEDNNPIHAANDNANSQTVLLNAAWSPTFLNTDVLSPTDKEIDEGKAEEFDERLRNWFRRMYFTPMQQNAVLHISQQHKQHFIVTGSIIGLLKPSISRYWPRANDNKKPLVADNEN